MQHSSYNSKRDNQFSLFEIQEIKSCKYKLTIKTTIKSMCSVAFSSIFFQKAFCKLLLKKYVVEFMFSKNLYFQHILLNSFKWTCLKKVIYESCLTLSSFFSSCNALTDTTVIMKDQMLNEKFIFGFKITTKWNPTK